MIHWGMKYTSMHASSSSSSNPTMEKHDVFPGFRGEDTRDNFTSHLLAALRRKIIETYFDEDNLERGDGISPALMKAIQQSKISIFIFSENYSSSSWCLNELVQILDCHKTYGQIVIPVFYKVDPSHIRKQQESYADAFVKHEVRFRDRMNFVQNWRNALTESAIYLDGTLRLSGYQVWIRATCMWKCMTQLTLLFIICQSCDTTPYMYHQGQKYARKLL